MGRTLHPRGFRIQPCHVFIALKDLASAQGRNVLGFTVQPGWTGSALAA